MPSGLHRTYLRVDLLIGFPIKYPSETIVLGRKAAVLFCFAFLLNKWRHYFGLLTSLPNRLQFLQSTGMGTCLELDSMTQEPGNTEKLILP